jgi:hypothetical protein
MALSFPPGIPDADAQRVFEALINLEAMAWCHGIDAEFLATWFLRAAADKTGDARVVAALKTLGVE